MRHEKWPPVLKAGGVFICAINVTVMLLVSIKGAVDLTKLLYLHIYKLIIGYIIRPMYTQQPIYHAYSPLQCPVQA